MKKYLNKPFILALSILLASFIITCGGGGGGGATYYEDADGDGFTSDIDCDDSDAAVNPGAEETCGDGVDTNCSGPADENCIYYRDVDGDGYGDPNKYVFAFEPPSGYVTDNTDCDDDDDTVHPGADELCDGIDHDCDGYASGGFVRVPEDYDTIQEAIDKALEDCVVLVNDGTYKENIDFNGKSITIQSVNGAENTIIDGDSNGSVVTFSYFEDKNSVLDGFTITNGTGTIHGLDRPDGMIKYYTDGGGIYCFSSSPTIKNCIISGNHVDSNGGGIYWYS